MLPLLRSWMPPDIDLTVISDRTGTIRASVNDIQYTLLITVAMVLLVVLVFLRRLVPTIAAAVTVPLSIAGTLAGMWFLGYSLDNFSLMALTISVGFVVDDAIVMIENIYAHRETRQNAPSRRRSTDRARSASPCFRSASRWSRCSSRSSSWAACSAGCCMNSP